MSSAIILDELRTAMASNLTFLKATVVARRMVTPGMVRLTLGGEGLAGLKSTGIGDEYIRLFFPDDASGELVLPFLDERGHWCYPEGRRPSHSVCYTIRAARTGEIDLDFVVHEHGRASDWALAARPGDEVVIREPHGIFDAPKDTDWFVFICDETGLPALGRLLEALPVSAKARAIVEIRDASHEQPLASPADLKVVWLHGSGNGTGPSRVLDVLRGMEMPVACKPYAWIATELREARAVRKYLRHELGWVAQNYSVTGYWVAEREEWQAGYAALDPVVKEEIANLWSSGRDQEDIADAVEAKLESHGL